MILGRVPQKGGQIVVFFTSAQGSRRLQNPSEVQLWWMLDSLQSICRTWYTQQCQGAMVPLEMRGWWSAPYQANSRTFGCRIDRALSGSLLCLLCQEIALLGVHVALAVKAALTFCTGGAEALIWE